MKLSRQVGFEFILGSICDFRGMFAARLVRYLSSVLKLYIY